MNIYEEIVTLQKTGARMVLATVTQAIGATPRKAGAKMVVLGDGSVIGSIGGGAIERLVQEEARSLFETGGTKIVERNLSSLGMQCGGSNTVFLECLESTPRLFIFGAGNIGASLAEMATQIGFRITVIDDRSEYANEEALSETVEIIHDGFVEAIDRLHFDENTYIAIMTYGHGYDYEILEGVIIKPHRYIGLVASRKKAATLFTRLAETGVDKKLIDTVHSPVGIDIGAMTPEEIAVSILAELVQVKNRTVHE